MPDEDEEIRRMRLELEAEEVTTLVVGLAYLRVDQACSKRFRERVAQLEEVVEYALDRALPLAV